MFRLISISLIIVPLFIGCERSGDITAPPISTNGSSVTFSFEKPANLDTIVVFAKAMVSAPDMDTIVVGLSVNPNNVEGTIQNIPAGPHRKFEIFTYDANSTLTYYGHAFADVPAGQVIDVTVTLYPINHTGTVIIVGTFAPFPPQHGKIVFFANYNGLNDIYIMDPDGSNITNLTNSSFDDIRPILSPDRSKISFNRIINGLSRPFVMNSDGTNPTELNILSGHNVAKCDWSPDGQWVTFNALYDGDDELFTYDLNSAQLYRLTENSYTDWAPTWSPQGDWIVYFSYESGIERIYKIRPDGSGKALINYSQVREEKHPRISPDGTKVVFYSRDNSAAWDIFIINLDGSNLVRLTNTPYVNEARGCWSPDGQKIVFVRSDGTSGSGLYLMNADGTGMSQLVDTPQNEEFPHWR